MYQVISTSKTSGEEFHHANFAVLEDAQAYVLRKNAREDNQFFGIIFSIVGQ